MKRLLASTLVALLLAGCTSEPERPFSPVKNIVFRLGAKKDAVELRLEADYFPVGNEELVAGVDMNDAEAKGGALVTVEGVRAPVKPSGAPAPAAAVVLLPIEVVDGKAFPLVLAVPTELSEGYRRDTLDRYECVHRADGWHLSKNQGKCTRFEPNGSY